MSTSYNNNDDISNATLNRQRVRESNKRGSTSSFSSSYRPTAASNFARGKSNGKSNNNPFEILNPDKDAVASKKKSASTKPSVPSLSTKLQDREKEIENVLVNLPTPDTLRFPLVPLTSWHGSKPSVVRIFESNEDESQLGPEMRSVYNYMEQVYQNRNYYNENALNLDSARVNSDDEDVAIEDTGYDSY